MKLLGEINCFGQCLRLSEFAPFIAFLIVISIALLAASLMLKNPKQRIMTFVSAQICVLVAIAGTFYVMKCSEMLSIYLYFAYVAASTIIIFGVLRYYDRIMVRRLSAKPVAPLMKWTQDFIDRLTSATVYYYDSAIPRAFASGRSIFVSLGLLEILNEDELKAVLAHEAWHIRNNSRTPYLKQLALMTFSSHKGSELEKLADIFAAEIAGSKALSSARDKLDKVFI